MLPLGRSFCVLWIVTLVGACAEGGDASVNVVLIVADDLNCAITPYGDRNAKTPNLDRLAARGVTFNHAYCQQAVCNPSRSSFLTGLRPDTVGVDDLRKYFRDTVADGDALVTLPQHFKNHGYFCQDVGKIFHNMGDTQDRRSWSVDEVLFRGTHAADTIFFANSGNASRPYKAPVSEMHDVDDTAYRDGKIGNLAAEAIRSRSTQSRPFFLAVGFWRPHLPFVAPKRYWDLYDPDTIAMPDPADPPAEAPQIALHESREIKGYGLTPRERPFTEQEIRHFRHGYYSSISFMDAQVGKILDALDENGLSDRTVIAFTSDHGFHIGEHGLWGKTTNFELDARVPLIICDPTDSTSGGGKTNALVELVDLFPTLSGLVGIDEDLPSALAGKSLIPILRDPIQSVKDAAYTQHPHPFYGPRENWQSIGYSIRTKRWRYTEWWTPVKESRALLHRELYDHRSDSRETVNVVADANRSDLSPLVERLRAHFRLTAHR
ncbi:MAG: sulfatase [Rubripirellula sp.]